MESQPLPHLQHQQIVSYLPQDTTPYPSYTLPQHSEQLQQLPEREQPYPLHPLTRDNIEQILLQMTNSSQTQTDSPNRKRRRLDAEGKRQLNQIFVQNPKPDAELRLQLAERFDMTSRGIQIWFQNQRYKAKRGIKTRGTGDDEKGEDSGSNSSRDVPFSDENPPDDTREGVLHSSPPMLGLSDKESSNSMHTYFAPTTEEVREHSSADKQTPTKNEPQSLNVAARKSPKSSEKQRRRRLNPEETEVLLQEFEQKQKPDTAFQLELSERMNLPLKVIRVWFQNQRAKRNRQSIPSDPHSHSGEEEVPICVNATGEEFEYQEVAVDSNNPTDSSWPGSMSLQPYSELQHNPLSTLHDQIAVMAYADHITTTSEPTNSSRAVSMSLQPYGELQHDTSSTLNNFIAVMPYADPITTTSEPCQSMTESNYSFICDTRKPSHKKKSSNSRRRSRDSLALSHDESPQQRRRMSKEEIRILSAVFARTRMPTIDTREDLAKQFDRTPRSIQIWFQNQRSKLKRGLVSLESYRKTGEGLMRRDIDITDADERDRSDGDGNDSDGEQTSINT